MISRTGFWSQELRLNAEITKQINSTLGAYYSDEKTTYYTLQDIRYVALGLPAPVCAAIGGLPTETCPIFPLQFIGNDPVRTKSKAVFGTVIWNAPMRSRSRAVCATPRTTRATPSIATISTARPSTRSWTRCIRSPATRRFSRKQDRLPVQRRLPLQSAGAGLCHRGHRLQGGRRGPRPFNVEQARSFGPEKLTSYELGLKTDLFDRRVRVNGDVFYNDFKDAQLTLLSCPQFGGPGPCALPQNAGKRQGLGRGNRDRGDADRSSAVRHIGSYIKWDWKCVNASV